MKCGLTNCQHEANWPFKHGNTVTHLCDDHYRQMADDIVHKVYDAVAGSVFARSMDGQLERKEKTLQAQPNPDKVAPNVSIAIAQATLATYKVFGDHKLTRVQMAVAANAIARVLIGVAAVAHQDAVVNN